MHKADKYDVRVLISLTTFWQDDDGILAYVKWAGLTYPKLKNTPYYTEQWAAKDKFWTSKKARSYYKKHMRVMFNRRNRFNSELLPCALTACMGFSVIGFALERTGRCVPDLDVRVGCCNR